MTAIATRTRLVTAAAALGLALAGCAGATDPGAAAPTTEDVGVQDGRDAGGDGAVVSGMCAMDQPDCQDTVVEPAGGASGSCPAGDEGCTDESLDGRDVARPVPFVGALAPEEDVAVAARGVTGGADGRTIEEATLLDDDTLRLAVIGNPCMVVEDVLVTESPTEVRVLVLAGQDPAVAACEDVGLWWSVDVDLAAPLGDRTVLDLAG